MTTAFECPIDKDMENGLRETRPENPPPQAEQVRVVVGPGHLSRITIATEGCPDAWVTISGDGHADPCPADEDTTLILAGGDGICHLMGDVGIVHALAVEAADVVVFDAPFDEGFHQLDLEVESPMVTPDDNVHAPSVLRVRRKIKVEFVPPKPNEFERATSTGPSHDFWTR